MRSLRTIQLLSLTYPLKRAVSFLEPVSLGDGRAVGDHASIFFSCISCNIDRYAGAPINITPLQDDPELGADPTRNDNFRYDFPDDQQTQTRCPFAAHTRKTNPRADLQDLGFPTENRRIMRAGIAFGPEVSPDEAASGKTSSGRGLLFVAYQSNIVDGFQFIQKSRHPYPIEL